MRYPLIHALSTVGILKHYNQDYLIHDERTDFTGANGVGKSIIADLFQLIFIHDKQLFQFGTEGYRKEARQIHKLPYKCRDAYAFLTIEVSKHKFICIGVCIPNTTSRPLKPFIITTNFDNQLPLGDRSFTLDKVPVAKHFINDKNQVSVVEELGRHFRDNYGLYFEFYSTRDQKDEHYARLYDQQILPINLSIPSSLKAFAKIIQSFSRARSGGDKSEDLKDFLFDGLEKEFEQLFDNHKNEIDKLLKDYDDLQTFIIDLEKKQLQLGDLDNLANKQLTAQKNYHLGNCGYSFVNSNKAQASLQSSLEEYDTNSHKLELLQTRLPHLLLIADGYKTRLLRSNSKLETITSCQELMKKVRIADNRIKDLTIENLPTIAEEFSGKHFIDEYQDSEVVRRCQTFIPIYRQYKSIAAIEKQIDFQKELIQNRKIKLNGEIDYLNLISRLFSDSSEQSLIVQIMKSDKTISIAQEAVLFHFIYTHWQKPENIGYPYYAKGFHFFNEDHITRDDKLHGYWLCMNDLNIFIPNLQNEPVLGNPDLRNKAISELLANNEILISIARTELAQLQLFEKGQDWKDVEILIGLDQRLYDYGITADFAITAQLVMQIDGKIDVLKKESEDLRCQIDEKLLQEGIDPATDIQTVLNLENSNFLCWKKRSEKFQQLYNNDSATKAAMIETSIPALKQQVDERKTVASRAMEVYLEDRAALEALHPELLTESLPEIHEEKLRELKKQYEDAMRNYQSQYLASCNLFRETAHGNNIEIATELSEGRYSFPLLERALLGSRIKFQDQISEELRTANRSRHKLIDSIHETMLKIFIRTKTKYEEYRTQVRDLNLFFKGKTISNKYFFQVDFIPSDDIPIEWINQLQSQSQHLYKPGELPIGESVDVFVEDFFKTAVGYKKKIAFRDLLDPKTYFTLDAGLTDEHGKEVSGSTGETYTAKVLLGIGRLSKVQSQNRDGIRFIILEETANLDKTNFNNFPAIAKEFGYQIITMTPKPFGADAAAGWYLHHLLPGRNDPDINYPMPASYFKTNTDKENLLTYLNKKAQ
jgi:exonuclease SbcC